MVFSLSRSCQQNALKINQANSWVHVLCYCAESVCKSKIIQKRSAHVTALLVTSPTTSSWHQLTVSLTFKLIHFKLPCVAWYPQPIDAEPMTNPSLPSHCLITRHYKTYPDRPPQEFVESSVLWQEDHARYLVTRFAAAQAVTTQSTAHNVSGIRPSPHSSWTFRMFTVLCSRAFLIDCHILVIKTQNNTSIHLWCFHVLLFWDHFLYVCPADAHVSLLASSTRRAASSPNQSSCFSFSAIHLWLLLRQTLTQHSNFVEEMSTRRTFLSTNPTQHRRYLDPLTHPHGIETMRLSMLHALLVRLCLPPNPATSALTPWKSSTCVQSWFFCLANHNVDVDELQDLDVHVPLELPTRSRNQNFLMFLSASPRPQSTIVHKLNPSMLIYASTIPVRSFQVANRLKIVTVLSTPSSTPRSTHCWKFKPFLEPRFDPRSVAQSHPW